MRSHLVLICATTCAVALKHQDPQPSADSEPPEAAQIAPLFDRDLDRARSLLVSELPRLEGNVAVRVHQAGREIFRFQRGDIDFDSRTPLASVSKTVSAAVLLDCAEEGLIDLDAPFGEEFPRLFPAPDGPKADPTRGSATHLDAWAMRSGIDADRGLEFMRRFNHDASVRALSRESTLRFAPGAALDYDGAGMQISGWIAAQRAELPWEELARARVFTPLGMASADYGHFGRNPSVPGGLRASADDLSRFARMVMAGGVWRGERLLEPESIELLFSDQTRGLPVQRHPWPESHPAYPSGERPTYGFGAWVLARDPVSGRVDEIVAAGAWGSVVWFDRKRGLTAVFVVQLPRGRERSQDVSLGLLAVLRETIERHQVRGLSRRPVAGGKTELTWRLPDAAAGAVVYGSEAPLDDVFDLESAVLLTRTADARATVAPYPHYAVLAEIGGPAERGAQGKSEGHVNVALLPGRNATRRNTAEKSGPDSGNTVNR